MARKISLHITRAVTGFVCIYSAIICTAQIQPNPSRYEASIAAFEDKDFSSPPPENAVLLVGSSSIGFWNDLAPADLSPLTVIPRGFGGSVMNDVIYYFDRVVAKYNPRAIVLYEGDNDLAWGLTPTTILSQLDTLIEMIKSNLPGTRLYILSVKPSIARAHLWDLAMQVNSGFTQRAKSDKDIFHIEVHTYLLNEDGSFNSNIYESDQLHLNTAGYEIWADVIRAALTTHEAPYESLSFGTNYYMATSELISDCVNLTLQNGTEPQQITLSFHFNGSTLSIRDFSSRIAQTPSCADQLEVVIGAGETVKSALYTTSKLYIRGQSTRYSLSAEFSNSRNPLSGSGNQFLFDNIEVMASN